MKNFFLRYLNLFILSLLFLVSITLLSSNIRESHHLSFPERVLLQVMSPFQRAINFTLNGAIHTWDNYIDLIHTKKENRELRKEVNWLRFENNILIEKNLMYRRLESLLSFYSVDNFRLELAHVIAKDFTSWNQIVMIGKGSQHGIQANMPVSTHLGLVGRTVFVSNQVSKVLLITDIRSAVDALVQRTRDSCVVVGFSPTLCNLKYLSVNAEVQMGDNIISSGLGGLFPKGLSIGTVTEINNQKDGLFQEVKVKPSADLTKLEELFVFLNKFEPDVL